jgi:inorganic pyrophosphatase
MTQIRNQSPEGIKQASVDTQTSLTVMIEIPRGSRNKYEYDKENRVMKYDRMIYASVQYPSDYGFIMDTLGKDGDALDALVLLWEPTFPGCVIEVKPIGMLKMWDDKGQDEKILCVPLCDPQWNHINEINEVPPHLLKEIQHFFEHYKTLEKKETKVEGWENRLEALKVIRLAQDLFVESK